MNIKRCGTCHFAEVIGQDLSKRVCWGAPPSAIQLPAGGGKLTLQMARPVVSVTDRACGLYRAKDEGDIARDEPYFTGAETKQ